MTLLCLFKQVFMLFYDKIKLNSLLPMFDILLTTPNYTVDSSLAAKANFNISFTEWQDSLIH